MSTKAPFDGIYKLCKEKRDDIEIFSVKLTDSALRTLKTISHKQLNPIKLSVNGNRGTLSIPGKQASVSYDLSISPLYQASDGTIDVIQFLGSHALNLGKALSKLTVQANADSFSAAKLRMAEAEDHRKPYSKPAVIANTKSSCVREENLNPRSLPTPPGSRNPDTTISPSSVTRSCSPSVAITYKSPSVGNVEVGARSLQDRIIHLLAVHSYQRSDLLLRLKRDGLTEEQKDKVDSILSKVGRLGKQREYHLSPTFVNLLTSSWPGYSPTERSFVASLKARLSTSSPNSLVNRVSAEGGLASRITPNSRQASPLITAAPAVATVASPDDFGRKPTCASAPSAPHALSKKIAALDLLASGLSLINVAARHGIPSTLLENWKSNESTLRLRYSQRRGSTVPQPADAPLSSTQEVSKNFMYSGGSVNSGTNSKPSAPKRARLSSNESGIHSCGSNSSISGNCPSQSVSSFAANRAGTNNPATALPPPCTLSSFKNPSPFSLGRRSPSRCKRPFGAVCDNNSSDAAPGIIAVGTDDQSRQGSAVSRPIDERSSEARQRPTHPRGSETSSCGDSTSPPGEPTPLPQFYTSGPVVNSKSGKGEPLYPGNEDKASNLSEEDYLYQSISSQNAEIERLYPAISNARQAAAYREAFESLYPKYLRLYEHFRDAWDKVTDLKERILALAGGPHVEQMTRLATELDEFLNRMREPERREDEVRLLVMTFKLQHLKQRLAAFASQEGTASAGGSAAQLRQAQSRSGLLRAGASD